MIFFQMTMIFGKMEKNGVSEAKLFEKLKIEQNNYFYLIFQVHFLSITIYSSNYFYISKCGDDINGRRNRNTNA